MLDPHEQPAAVAAQRVIGTILAEIYRRFAQWALAAGGALWLVSLPLSWM